MCETDPAKTFEGVILIVAPHMDDEVLACGATMAALPEKNAIHVIYATDGARSPIRELPWDAKPNPALVSIRTTEARDALDTLGIPAANATFLGLPDGSLKGREKELVDMLVGHIRLVQPDHVFAPFRLDRHPDHLAVHRATVRALQLARSGASLNEYFVYFRWRLLPGGDIRKVVRDDLRICIPVLPEHADRKRRALDCYASQTTRYFKWQTRPILAPANIKEVCATPECFLQTESGCPNSGIFSRWALWIPFAHTLEPRLKQLKEWSKSIWRWLRSRSAYAGGEG